MGWGTSVEVNTHRLERRIGSPGQQVLVNLQVAVVVGEIGLERETMMKGSEWDESSVGRGRARGY